MWMIEGHEQVSKVRWHARIAAIVALFACIAADADIVLSSRTTHAEPGAQMQADLTITNERTEPLIIELPDPLHMRFETAAAVSTLSFIPSRSGAIAVQPGGFVKIALLGTLPAEVQGTATLVPTGIDANHIAVQIDTVSPDTLVAQTADPAERATAVPMPTPIESRLIDKPPPLAVSVYEPVYFIVGGDGGLNAKFQISFRYRLFDGKGSLASRLSWIDDLYLSFSQTSLWDLGELSKPFKDSSYRPRLFFGDYDLMRALDGRLRLGFEAGAGHESNGKDGDESRSFNMLYVRPALTLGDPDGFRLYAAPLIHNYIADDENPDLKDYRGYVDWLFGAGSKGGLDFWAVVRKGERSDFGSTELNLSYPLSKLSGGDLTGWLTLQYFGGYGESLLDYNRKLDSQLRVGIAIAL